jgi:hypothetical protein
MFGGEEEELREDTCKEPFKETFGMPPRWATPEQVIDITAALWQLIEGGRERGWPDRSIVFNKKRPAEYMRLRAAIERLNRAIFPVLHERGMCPLAVVLAPQCARALKWLQALLDRLHGGTPESRPPLKVSPEELRDLRRVHRVLEHTIARLAEVEATERQARTAGQAPQPAAVAAVETTGASPEPRASAAETIDPEDARVLDRLRREGKALQATLMELMLKQGSASLDEVKRHVYPDYDISKGGVRQLVWATNKSLTDMESPLRLYTKSHWVHLDRSPE